MATENYSYTHNVFFRQPFHVANAVEAVSLWAHFYNGSNVRVLRMTSADGYLKPSGNNWIAFDVPASVMADLSAGTYTYEVFARWADGSITTVQEGTFTTIDAATEVPAITGVYSGTPIVYYVAPDLSPSVVGQTMLAAGETTVVTTGITNPDVPRTLVVNSNAPNFPSGNVIIVGTDIEDNVITETVAAGSETTKAFKTVTSVTFPAQEVDEFDNMDIDGGQKFGLPARISTSLQVPLKVFNGSPENGAVGYNASDISKNLYTPVGTPDGTKVIYVLMLI